MKLLSLCLLAFALPCVAQTPKTGDAKTTGSCSPAVSGDNNQFTINCQGISKAMGTKMIELLNKVVANQTTPDAIEKRVDETLKALAYGNLRERTIDLVRDLHQTTESRVETRPIAPWTPEKSTAYASWLQTTFAIFQFRFSAPIHNLRDEYRQAHIEDVRLNSDLESFDFKTNVPKQF
jgi:hypothetical protein